MKAVAAQFDTEAIGLGFFMPLKVPDEVRPFANFPENFLLPEIMVYCGLSDLGPGRENFSRKFVQAVSR